MISLKKIDLEQSHLDKLKKNQDEINNELTYVAQIAKGLEYWKTRKNNKTFDRIKELLTEMSSGVKRCHYCEDSLADEIEHFKPKSIFPEQCFVCENYLYACGSCNGPKNDQFAIFKTSDNQFLNITPPHHTKRLKNYVPTKPPAGDSALINPRTMNPMDYLELDIIFTFNFAPIEKNKTSKEYIMATFTIKALGLNHRGDMPKMREAALGTYWSRLKHYATAKKENPTNLIKLKERILKDRHPTVWKEMIRWYKDIQLTKVLKMYHKDLHQLFQNNPEVLDW